MLSSCGSKDNLACANHMIVMWLSCDCCGYRPYAIDIIISCNRQWTTLCRHFEWSMERKYSRAVSDFLSQRCKKRFPPRMHKVSTGLMLTKVNKLTSMCQWSSHKSVSLYLRSIDRGFPCHSNGGVVSGFLSHVHFMLIWSREVLHEVYCVIVMWLIGVFACNCLVTVLWLVWSLCGLWLLKLSWPL